MEIMDESITEEQLSDLFKMADTDRDGKICYEGKTIIECPSHGICGNELPITCRFHEDVAVKE